MCVTARRRSERGIALATTLLLVTLLSAMSLAMVLSVSSDMLINGYYGNERGSFYAADSGATIARQAIISGVLAAVPQDFLGDGAADSFRHKLQRTNFDPEHLWDFHSYRGCGRLLARKIHHHIGDGWNADVHGARWTGDGERFRDQLHESSRQWRNTSGDGVRTFIPIR